MGAERAKCRIHPLLIKILTLYKTNHRLCEINPGKNYFNKKELQVPRGVPAELITKHYFYNFHMQCC